MGVIKERAQLDPAGSDIGSGQGMQILAGSGLSAFACILSMKFHSKKNILKNPVSLPNSLLEE